MSIRPGKQATLVDVARKAEVSYQTVSRVINGHPSVAPGTRERVERAIVELDYRPNAVARSLVTRRTRTVGIVRYGTSYFGPGQMLANIEESLRQDGYGITLSTITRLGFRDLQLAVRELRGRSVDGIVMITPILEVELRKVAELCSRLPFVMIDVAPGEDVPSVAIDQRRGGALALRHLLESGHRRIAEICGPQHWNDARLRREGWQDELDQAGLKSAGSQEGDWSAESGYRAAKRLLEQGTEFTALVAGNDQMALGAMRALREAGVLVPDEVSVVGFDDLPEAAFFEPPLTTVRQDFVSLGKQSAEYLTKLMEQPDSTFRQCVIEPELVVRESTRRRR